ERPGRRLVIGLKFCVNDETPDFVVHTMVFALFSRCVNDEGLSDVAVWPHFAPEVAQADRPAWLRALLFS
ncbi:MAG: hypothetical protein Q4E12_04025, partial [Coriobacteriia bacterium]|nr:hypothetical protein [Coriobacteriia bacterium]